MLSSGHCCGGVQYKGILEHTRHACSLQHQLQVHSPSARTNLHPCALLGGMHSCWMGTLPDRATLEHSSAAPTSRHDFARERYRTTCAHCGLHQLLLPTEVILTCNMALQSQFGEFFSSPCQQASVTIPSTTSEWTCGLKLSGTFNCSRKPPPTFHNISASTKLPVSAVSGPGPAV